MEFSLPTDDDPRRLAVRAWLEAHPNPGPAILAEAGYVAPGWSSPWGLGADPEHQMIINDELEAVGVDPHQHNPIGIGWAGPTLVAAGTQAQKDRFIWPLLRGNEYWCQLFSEPGAGSDLAGLATRADQDGDTYVINGQKVWTTWADRADYGILLARTDSRAPKHRGISYFICPMRQPGIEVRPIKEMTGRAHFNEVFLTNARIPADHLVGEENQGWALAKHTLGNERVTLSSGGVLWGMGPTTAQVLRDLPQPLGPSQRDEAVSVHIEAEIMRLLGLRIMSDVLAGKPPGAEVALKKLLADRHGQRVMELAREVLGADGMLNGDSDQSWGFLFSRALTIGGGTTELLHNIIGEQMLGLPKEAAAR